MVDDASNDDTEDFLRSLNDSRVRVVRQAIHAERSAARNRGLAEARGEFVMFLDDDDLLRPEALARLVQTLRSHTDAVAAVGACRILEVNWDSFKVYHPEKAYKRIIWREMLFGWWANSGQNLYRTTVVREIGGYDPNLHPCEDRKLWLDSARRGPVCLVPFVAMEYRQHAGQSKPANLDEIRQSVWNQFIATLPASEQRQARRIRRAAELVEQSEKARERHEFGAALWAQLQACWTVPYLLTSPLTARPLWWGLKKCFLRVSAP